VTILFLILNSTILTGYVMLRDELTGCGYQVTNVNINTTTGRLILV